MVGQSLEFTSFETECFEQHFSNVLRSLNINPNGVEGEIQVPGMVLKEFFKSSLLPTLVLKEVIFSILFFIFILFLSHFIIFVLFMRSNENIN